MAGGFSARRGQEGRIPGAPPARRGAAAATALAWVAVAAVLCAAVVSLPRVTQISLAGKRTGPFTRGPKAQLHADTSGLPGWARRSMRQIQKKVSLKQDALARSLGTSLGDERMSVDANLSVVSDAGHPEGGAGLHTFVTHGVGAFVGTNLPGKGPGNATEENGQWGFWRTHGNSNNENERRSPVLNNNPLGDHVVGQYLDTLVNTSDAEQSEGAANPLMDVMSGKGLPKMFYEDDMFSPCPAGDPKCKTSPYGYEMPPYYHDAARPKIWKSKRSQEKGWKWDSRHRINCTDPTSPNYHPACENALTRTRDALFNHLGASPEWRLGHIDMNQTMKVPYPATGYYGGLAGPPFNTEGMVGAERRTGLFKNGVGKLPRSDDRHVPAQAIVGHVLRPFGDEQRLGQSAVRPGVVGGAWDQEFYLPLSVPPESYFLAREQKDLAVAKADAAPAAAVLAVKARSASQALTIRARHGAAWRAPWGGGGAHAPGDGALAQVAPVKAGGEKLQWIRRKRGAARGRGGAGLEGVVDGGDDKDAVSVARGDVPLVRMANDVEGWLDPVRRAASHIEATRADLKSAGREVASMKDRMDSWRTKMRTSQPASYPSFAKEREREDYASLIAQDAKAVGALPTYAAPTTAKRAAGDGSVARVGSWLRGLLAAKVAR